ncbi:hypothetical protein, partial [Burkholderia stabilis]|uniref:hypothetical protein n=1 Tax=Burkholderia stabilis TaxID=95485 RepID=UPI001ABADBE9
AKNRNLETVRIRVLPPVLLAPLRRPSPAPLRRPATPCQEVEQFNANLDGEVESAKHQRLGSTESKICFGFVREVRGAGGADAIRLF